jgi:hypothetical protein
MKKGRSFILLLAIWVSAPACAETAEEQNLASFANPARIWGKGVESVIEEAYRQCFKTFIINGQVMNLRLPFAENHERDELIDDKYEFVGGGKAAPAALWQHITEILASSDFQKYVAVLGDGSEKVIIFDIPAKTWTVSLDLFDIARMKAGAYHGLPHKPYVLVRGKGLKDTDVYNYLYCVGWTGIDCSGFVWHVLSQVAKQEGVDLGRELRRSVGAPRGADSSSFVGTWFFGSRSKQIIQVKDTIRNLKPADVILFRDKDGGIAHSAVIQSVDLKKGIIRYLQSTDEAPLEERGVHESFIRFDPAHLEVSLHDPALKWSQARYSPFPGEQASPFSNDGERYRAFPQYGGGKVIRLRALSKEPARHRSRARRHRRR